MKEFTQMVREGRKIRQLGAAGIAAVALGLGIFTGAQAALYSSKNDLSGQWQVQVMESTPSGRIEATGSYELNVTRYTIEKTGAEGREAGVISRLDDGRVVLDGPVNGTYRVSKLADNVIVLDGDTAETSLYLVRK